MNQPVHTDTTDANEGYAAIDASIAGRPARPRPDAKACRLSLPAGMTDIPAAIHRG